MCILCQIYGSTPDLDIEMLSIINDPNYDCDGWKLYPTSVITSEKDIEDVNTVIEKWYIDGKYVP